MVDNTEEQPTLWVCLWTESSKTRLTLVIGADDPSDLMREPVYREVANLASKLGYTILKGKSEVEVFGQNELARRKFYFKR